MSTEERGWTGGEPETDRRQDPRATDETVTRVRRRTRASRVGAVIAAVVLVVGGVVFVGFATDRLSIPGLGTLSGRPADASTLYAGRDTYLFQDGGRARGQVTVTRQTSSSAPAAVADLPEPTDESASWAVDAGPDTASAPRTTRTYVAVLPAGAQVVTAVPKATGALTALSIGPVRSATGQADMVGVVVVVTPPQDSSQGPPDGGLSVLRWTSADGQARTTTITS